MSRLPIASIKRMLISSFFVFIVVVIVSINLFKPGASTPPGMSSASPSAEITQTPTSISPLLSPTVAAPPVDPREKVIATFSDISDSGDEVTPVFEIGDHWRIEWLSRALCDEDCQAAQESM